MKFCVTIEASDLNEAKMKEANFNIQKRLVDQNPAAYIPVEYERWKEIGNLYDHWYYKKYQQYFSCSNHLEFCC